MQIQQPNVGTFGRADYRFLQKMSDNDDAIRNQLELNAKGVIALGIANNLQLNSANYSNSLGTYQQNTSANWIDVNFTQPNTSRITANFESNRYYKFTLHFDYVWAANASTNASSSTGETGRIEIRVRDFTHRHDILYWTNLIDPDYQMGGYTGLGGGYWFHRDTNNNPNRNIYTDTGANMVESAKGAVPSSCHAFRVMPAKTSGAAILKVQYRPMMAYGGVQPPLSMNCSGGKPVTGLPQQYDNGTGDPRSSEAIQQFNGYFSVEDCGPTEKPAGVQPGVLDDFSASPYFEAYENHPYDSTATERP